MPDLLNDALEYIDPCFIEEASDENISLRKEKLNRLPFIVKMATIILLFAVCVAIIYAYPHNKSLEKSDNNNVNTISPVAYEKPSEVISPAEGNKNETISDNLPHDQVNSKDKDMINMNNEETGNKDEDDFGDEGSEGDIFTDKNIYIKAIYSNTKELPYTSIETDKLYSSYSKKEVDILEEKLTSDEAAKKIEESLKETFEEYETYETINKSFTLLEDGQPAMIYEIRVKPTGEAYVVIGLKEK